MDSKLIIFLLVLILGIVLGIWISRELQARKKRDRMSVSFIEAKLSDCSDLTTCSLEYVGLVKYENGTIPFMTKKSFSMIYQANIRAGVDLADAVVTMGADHVKVQLPEATVQVLNIDTENLKFYDEHFALFNWDRKEDLGLAVKAARDDVEQNAHLEDLKKQAYRQAKTIIYRFLEPSLEKGKQLIVE